ncbi:GNAT family N-acetyltransferase [Janibacter limosus]|uniref:GNAT family N-acetyltransferase n=2 Tax=Janibacter limosus TaxID=53458 RepID=A0A4P6MTW9_9MICO|nr:GNAT family N-acetyltransferase [Janibacter limosus]
MDRREEGMHPVDIVSFASAIDRSAFSCGKPELDDWLKHHAGQQERSGNTRTFLAIDHVQDGVAGYYATTTYRLELGDAARLHGSQKRRYPISAVLLARLAVDEKCARRGIGRQLLLHALMGFAQASQHLGFEMVVVHAFDVDAVTFYTTHGFTPFADNPMHLYLTTKQLRATINVDMP